MSDPAVDVAARVLTELHWDHRVAYIGPEPGRYMVSRCACGTELTDEYPLAAHFGEVGVAALCAAAGDADVDALAEVCHDAYEEASITSGWQTQPASRRPWAQVPEANRAATRAGVRAVLGRLLVWVGAR